MAFVKFAIFPVLPRLFAKEPCICLPIPRYSRAGLALRRLPIPPLEKGYNSLSQAFTSCRNYQFGVSYLLPMQDDKPL